MLVYANHISFQGPSAERLIFKAIGVWLKEQLGFGLHPVQLVQTGSFKGKRGELPSWLNICVTSEKQPEFYSWLLKTQDEHVSGRQWITEIGVKIDNGIFELTCVLRTEEQSTLVAAPVVVSRPRLLRYVISNIEKSSDANICSFVPGITIKSAGDNLDSYRALLADIERPGREYPIIMVSPDRTGDYLVNVSHLQDMLMGLGQVVQVSGMFNSYEMQEVLGQRWSAWDGAINIFHIPMPNGYVRTRLFKSIEIEELGATQHDRVTSMLSWVTSSTNIPRLRRRISQVGVKQLALKRRLDDARAKSTKMEAVELRDELENASRLVNEQLEWIEIVEGDNAGLDSDVKSLKADLDETKAKLQERSMTVQSLKGQLQGVGGYRVGDEDIDRILEMACRSDQPTPIECIEVIENVHGDRCVVLDSARDSAVAMNSFAHGRQLLSMLLRLVTEYRDKLLESGDSQARKVFGQNEFAAKESESVMSNKAMRQARTFKYKGEPISMFRHLKIGVKDDVEKTIRVHFDWDSLTRKIVIGYCGAHLPISSA